MEKSVEIFVGVNCFVIGISHLFQANAWVEFFKILRSYGKAGSFLNGFLSLSFGSIIISFHWIWEGIVPTLITCFGIAQIIKSIVAFAVPDLGLRSLSSRAAGSEKGYRIGGAIFLIFSLVIASHLMTS